MKPILFNTDMVRALLAGRKSVTRRVVRPQLPGNVIKICDVDPLGYMAFQTSDQLLGGWQNRKCQYEPGSVLYVRETWTIWDGDYEYKADVDDGYGPFCSNCTLDICTGGCNSVIKWHPSIHMPREAARIFLRVTSVRVERLQEITELDILEKEGATVDFPQPKPSYMSLAYTETRLKPAIRKSFADLWNSTIKKADRGLYGWDANPWVWVIEFERISKEDIPPAELAR